MSYSDWMRFFQVSGVMQAMKALAAQATEVANRAPSTAAVSLLGTAVGVLVASQPIISAVTPQALTLPKSLAGSYAYCRTAPASDVTCAITRTSGGVTTQIGTVNFAKGSLTGTFSFASDVTTLAGDIVEVLAPATVDGFFARPTLGLSATVSVADGYVSTHLAAYTPVATDLKGLQIMNAPSAVVNPLPSGTGATGNFPNGWRTKWFNVGANVTFAPPAGKSLNGVLNGTKVITKLQTVETWTDGSDWFAI
jgi:hypothetical protein